MIAINCSNCRQRLEMDDAFAGGVCRCQFCGTIQTVPTRAGSKGRASSPGAPGTSASKQLYSKSEGQPAAARGPRKPPPPPAAAAGSGLDELAEIVASSGLARGSLRKTPAGPVDNDSTAGAGAGRKPFPMMPVLIGGGIALAVVLGIVIYFATRPAVPAPTAQSSNGNSSVASAPHSSATADPNAAATEQPPPAPKMTGPAFADVALPRGAVVYLVDRSQSNDEVLDALKTVVYKSARSLGPNRAFQIIFWNRADEGIVAYPENAVALASAKEVDAATKRFEDVVSYGTTDLKPTLQKALKVNPAVIVIVSAKGFALEDANVAMAKAALNGKSVQVHGIAIGDGESPVLKQIAQLTGGEYRQFTPDQLRAFAR